METALTVVGLDELKYAIHQAVSGITYVVA